MITAIQRGQLLKLINYRGNQWQKVGKSVYSIMEDLGFSMLGGKLLLSEEQKQLIVKYVREHHGEDLEKSYAPYDKSRMALSEVTPDEKRGGYSVFSSMLNFSGNTSLWFTDGSSIKVCPNAVVSCELKILDTSKITSLVVVENGDTIIHAKALITLLPERFKDSLVVFRGYGENVRHVQELVMKLNDECQIAYFFDYDPSGLKMMVAEAKKRKSSLLMPKTLTAEVIRLNKKDKFGPQSNDMKSIYENRDTFSTELRAHIEIIHDREYAITQGNLVAHGIRLEEIMLY